MKTTFSITTMVGALLVLTPSLAVVSNANGHETGADCAVERDAEGRQIWLGDPPPELEDLTFALEDIAEEHPDEVAGVTLCSDYGGAQIAIKPTGSAARAAVDDLPSRSSSAVMIVDAPFSLNELRNELEQLEPSYDRMDVIGSYPKADGTGIVLLADASVEPDLQITILRQASDSTSVPIEIELSEPVNPATRRSDSAPHEGGVEIDLPGGGVCSLGLPVYYLGVKRALTAGHCVGPQTHNGNNTMGSW